jgi:hypothetical protein
MSIILAIHVIAFSLSLILSAGTLMRSLAGKRISGALTTINTGVTTSGALTGVTLLVSKPLGAYCAALLAYVVIFALVQRFINVRNGQLAELS